MIKNIALKNFRSILDAKVQFTDLTVIVGANASGKSNLIKALQFISMIPQKGIESTVISYGGANSLLPKAIPKKDFAKSELEINYSVDISRPKYYPKDLSSPTVDHQFTIGFNVKGMINKFREKITYNEALAIAGISELTKQGNLKEDQPKKKLLCNSKISINRKYMRTDKIEYTPEVRKDNLDLFLSWFGLTYLEKNITTVKDFEQLILRLEKRGKEISTTKRRISDDIPESLLDSGGPSYLTFCPQANRFRDIVLNIKRYDLLQDELRKEQQYSTSDELSSEGRNMPSALRYIKRNNSEGHSWDRILTTLMELNPHINSAEVSSLQTGKDFVEFMEIKLNRSVESWEASDGTLKGLAIMLALETQPRWSTIIIEEPEQNMHPWAIRSLMNYIRQVIEDRNIQVILTTHSQQLLETISPNELLVATRTAEEGTKFSSLKNLMPNHSIEMGEVGRMWVKGLLGGVPSHE
jgi:predicted ATPase